MQDGEAASKAGVGDPPPALVFPVSDGGIALADPPSRRKRPVDGAKPRPPAAAVVAAAASLLAAGAAALDPRSLALATAARGDAESAWRTYAASEAAEAGVEVADGPPEGKAAPGDGGTRVAGRLVAGVTAASARATVDACLDLVAALTPDGVVVGVDGGGAPWPPAPAPPPPAACPTTHLAASLMAWLTCPGAPPPLVVVGAAGPAVDGTPAHLAHAGVDARVALVVPPQQGGLRWPRLLAEALAGAEEGGGGGPTALLLVSHDGGLAPALPTLASFRAAPWKAYGLPVASLAAAGPAPGVGRVSFARDAVAALSPPALVVISYTSSISTAAAAAAAGKTPKLSPQLARRLAASAAGAALAALRSALPAGHLLPPADRHLLASLPFVARALAEVGARAAPGGPLTAALDAAVVAAGGATPRDALLAALVDAADRERLEAGATAGEEGEDKGGGDRPSRAAPVPLAVTDDGDADDDIMWAPLAPHEADW